MTSKRRSRFHKIRFSKSIVVSATKGDVKRLSLTQTILFSLVIVIIIPTLIVEGEDPASTNADSQYPSSRVVREYCNWIPPSKTLYCINFRPKNQTNLTRWAEPFMEPWARRLGASITSQIRSIRINQSTIPILDLSQFGYFSTLLQLVITNSNIYGLQGKLPDSLKYLNLSNNCLQNNETDGNSFRSTQLEDLDLSYNNLEELPDTIFSIGLKRLSLIGNKIKCSWVTGKKFYEWASKNPNVINRIEDTFCLSTGHAFKKNNTTVQSALKIREKAMEECNRTNCECDIRGTIVEGDGNSPFKVFPAIHSSKYGNVSFTLGFHCSNMGLVELPPISKYTVLLSLSHNSIRDLSRLATDENYRSLRIIDLSHNQIENLDSFIQNPVVDGLQAFSLKNNSISRLTSDMIKSIFHGEGSSRHREKIELGDNTIHCDCDTFKSLKPTLITREAIIKDWKTIRCTSPNVTLNDLRHDEACSLDIEEKSNEWAWWIIVGIEGILIGLILFKLWIDRRKYVRTGHLPSLSNYVPRLPCDVWLEGIKDSNDHHSHHNHHTIHKI